MRLRWKKIALALLVITAGGAVRLPLEHSYTQRMRAQELLERPLNLSLRDELGQSFFIAVLGGFRSMVATIMELRAVTPWMRGNFGIVEECYALCTRLQPREEHYWQQRAWHQADNARDNYLWDSRLTPANRRGLAQQAVEHGIAILEDGVKRLPQSWRLWDRLGDYTGSQYNQEPDFPRSVEAFDTGAALPGAPGTLRRQAAYKLCRIPGREREAWDRLLGLYYDPDPIHRMPSVEIELAYFYFERKLALQYPDIVLPEEIFRLFTSLPATLTAAEQKHRQRLAEGLVRRKDRNPWAERGPRISTPTLQSPK